MTGHDKKRRSRFKKRLCFVMAVAMVLCSAPVNADPVDEAVQPGYENENPDQVQTEENTDAVQTPDEPVLPEEQADETPVSTDAPLFAEIPEVPVEYEYPEYYDEEPEYTGPWDETEASYEGSVSAGSLQRLINEAEPGVETTVVLEKDVSLSSQLKIDSGRRIVIDLRGHRLSAKARYVRSPGFHGKYEISVNGAGTLLRIKDSKEGDNRSRTRGSYSVSSDNGIAVFNDASVEIDDAAIEQGDESFVILSAKTGGLFSVSSGTVSGNLDDEWGGRIELTGGWYSHEPESSRLADGYGYAVYKSAAVYRYEVRKRTKVAIRPVLNESYVLKGVTLSESGLRPELYGEDGLRLKGALISGGLYVETDESGRRIKDITLQETYDDVGTRHFLTLMNGSFPDEIEITDAADKNLLLTDTFDIINADSPDPDDIISFDVEDSSKDELRLSLKENREIFYGSTFADPFDIFDVVYIHDGNEKILDKGAGVEFDLPDGMGEGRIQAGQTIRIAARCLSKEASLDVTVQKQPVAIVGNEVSTLVGEAVSERYYGKINVYPLKEDKTTLGNTSVSVNASMSEWTDVSTSLIDSSQIDNSVKGVYEGTALSDIKGLNEKMSQNYELYGTPCVTYVVKPSIIMDFMTAGSRQTIADRKIMSADQKSCVVGTFSNGRSTRDASWMVGTVSVNEDGTSTEKMSTLSEAGITVDPANNGKGAVFRFDEAVTGTEGGIFNLYEILSEVKATGKSDIVLSVDPIMPVTYTGDRFTASDDTRSFSGDTPKAGCSPVLEINVREDGKKLIAGTDYVLSYKNNVNVPRKKSEASPVVIITGKGKYSGIKLRAYFTILPADLSAVSRVKLKNDTVRYSGSRIHAPVTLLQENSDGREKEISPSDYDVIIYDENDLDVTNVNYDAGAQVIEFRAALRANGNNPNYTGTVYCDDSFYGIPRDSRRFRVGGVRKTVIMYRALPAKVSDFIDPAVFYVKTQDNSRYGVYDCMDNGVISIDLVDSKNEREAVTYTEEGVTEPGTYYLKIQYANEEDKRDKKIFEPTYVQVRYR